MLHWIDFDIVYLCSCCSSSCCIWFWHCLSVFSWLFLMLHLIDCEIVYLCSQGSSLCCIGLSVALFIYVLMVHPHVALYWFWQCLSVFLCFFLMLHWIDCDIVYLCAYGSSSYCIILIMTWFVFFLVVLPHVAWYWLWHCLYTFSLVFFMLHCLDIGIFYLCSYGLSSCFIGLIVTLFIFVLVVLSRVALDSLWHCLSVFLWFLLMLPWIDCDIVICVPMVLPHVALDW